MDTEAQGVNEEATQICIGLFAPNFGKIVHKQINKSMRSDRWGSYLSRKFAKYVCEGISRFQTTNMTNHIKDQI